MGEGIRFRAGMPLESMNGLTQRAKKGAALLERGTLGGRFNGIRLMRALLFVLSEQQDCRPGAGYDGADDGVGGGDAAFHDAGDDKQGDGLKPDEHCGDGGGKIVEGDARKPDAPGGTEEAAERKKFENAWVGLEVPEGWPDGSEGEAYRPDAHCGNGVTVESQRQRANALLEGLLGKDDAERDEDGGKERNDDPFVALLAGYGRVMGIPLFGEDHEDHPARRHEHSEPALQPYIFVQVDGAEQGGEA